MQSNASSLPIICNLHVVLLLVNVMFSSEYSYFTMACRAFHTYICTDIMSQSYSLLTA